MRRFVSRGIACLATDPAGLRTAWVLWLLAAGGEPWLWSLRPERLGRFLGATGWTNALERVGVAGQHGAEL